MEINEKSIENQFFKKIIYKKNYKNEFLLNKFDKKWFVNIISSSLLEKYKEKFYLNHKVLNLINFLKYSIIILPYEIEDLFFIIYNLIIVFNEISQNDIIKYKDFLNWINGEFYLKNNNNIYKNQELLLPKKSGKLTNSLKKYHFEVPKKLNHLYDNVFTLNMDKFKYYSIILDIKYNSKTVYIKKLNSFLVLNIKNNYLEIIYPDIKKPKILKNESNNLILYYSYSDFLEVIGAVTKNNILIFYEIKDNFKFILNIDISNKIKNDIIGIYFINFWESWLLVDKENYIYKLSKNLNSISDRFKPCDCKEIVNIIPIESLNNLIIVTRENEILICNFFNKVILFRFIIKSISIRKIKYFEIFNLLLIIGYETNIYMFKINLIHNELSNVGKLIGHSHLVTAIECLENTLFVVSCDENGYIKLWNITNLKCIQTTNLQSKVIMDIKLIGSKLAFINNRIMVINLDIKNKNIKKNLKYNGFKNYNNNLKNSKNLIKTLFCKITNEILVLQKNYLKIYSITNGRLIYEFENIFENEEEINLKDFLFVNNDKSIIFINQIGQIGLFDYNKKEMVKVINTNSEVTHIIKDPFNNIINILFNNGVFKIINKNFFNDKYSEIRSIKNLNKEILVNKIDISFYYKLIVIASIDNNIYLLDYEFFEIKLNIKLNLINNSKLTSLKIMNESFHLLLGFKNSKVIIIELYYSKKVLELKIKYVIDLKESYPTNFYILSKFNKNINENKNKFNLKKIRLLIILKNGFISMQNLNTIIENTYMKAEKFNLDRTIKKDFKILLNNLINIYEINDSMINKAKLFSKLIFHICLFKDKINSLEILEFDKKYIFASCINGNIKLIDLKGNLKVHININFPLPFKCDQINILNEKLINKNIVHTIKIINVLKKAIKPKNKKLYKNFKSLINFIDENLKNEENNIILTNFNSKKTDDIFIMKEEYNPNDFYYSKDNFNKKDILTLKQLKYKNEMSLDNSKEIKNNLIKPIKINTIYKSILIR